MTEVPSGFSKKERPVVYLLLTLAAAAPFASYVFSDLPAQEIEAARVQIEAAGAEMDAVGLEVEKRLLALEELSQEWSVKLAEVDLAIKQFESRQNQISNEVRVLDLMKEIRPYFKINVSNYLNSNDLASVQYCIKNTGSYPSYISVQEVSFFGVNRFGSEQSPREPIFLENLANPGVVGPGDSTQMTLSFKLKDHDRMEDPFVVKAIFKIELPDFLVPQVDEILRVVGGELPADIRASTHTFTFRFTQPVHETYINLVCE